MKARLEERAFRDAHWQVWSIGWLASRPADWTYVLAHNLAAPARVKR